MKRLHALFSNLPRETRKRLTVHTILGAVSNTGVLVVVTLAAQHAQDGGAGFTLLLALGLAVIVFSISQNAVMSGCAKEVADYIHMQRDGLFQDIRRAPPAVLEEIGRQPLHLALTQNCQLIARHLPYLVMALQQAVLLIAVFFYLAWLSVIAFLIAALFSAIALSTHIRRMKRLGEERRAASAAERALFDGLRELLRGFKEAKMSRNLSAALGRELAGASARTRDSNAGIQRRWGIQFALIEVMFYLLVGLMVFVAPLLIGGYQDVVVPATTAALFMIGPIATLAMTLPAVDDVEAAMADIETLRGRLSAASATARDETALPLDGPVEEIALQDVAFQYGSGFALGPVSAVFRAGQISFITGGNGAGKSTLLHLLTGLLEPRSGHVLVNGKALHPGQEQAYRDRISAVFSDFHLFRVLYGIGAVEPKHATELLETLQMADKVTIRDGAFSTTDLSSGQRKRLALVLAELEDRPIIVLDEWAADQDPHFRRVFYREILPSLKARGKIVICVTHDDRYFDAADQLLRMDEGKLQALDRP